MPQANLKVAKVNLRLSFVNPRFCEPRVLKVTCMLVEAHVCRYSRRRNRVGFEYLMKLDTFTQSNAIPAWHLLRATQNQQQFVVSVCFCIRVTAILWGMTLPVRRHPDLQASHRLLIMIELLQCRGCALYCA